MLGGIIILELWEHQKGAVVFLSLSKEQHTVQPSDKMSRRSKDPHCDTHSSLKLTLSIIRIFWNYFKTKSSKDRKTMCYTLSSPSLTSESEFLLPQTQKFPDVRRTSWFGIFMVFPQRQMEIIGDNRFECSCETLNTFMMSIWRTSTIVIWATAHYYSVETTNGTENRLVPGWCFFGLRLTASLGFNTTREQGQQNLPQPVFGWFTQKQEHQC